MLQGGRKTFYICIAYLLATIVYLVSVVKTGSLGENFTPYLDYLKWVTGIGVFGVAIENTVKRFGNDPSPAPVADQK